MKFFLITKDTTSEMFDVNGLDEATSIAISQSEDMNKVHYLYGRHMMENKQHDYTIGHTYRKNGVWAFQYVHYNEPVSTVREWIKFQS